MSWTRGTVGNGPVVVTRLGETVWVLRPTEALAGGHVLVLRDTFLEAADSGAQSVVVDLSEVDTITTEGAAMLVAMADLMLGRSGLLWIAARSHQSAEHVLRPIEEHGPRALVGVASALDASLEPLMRRATPPAGNGLRKPSHDADPTAMDPGARLRLPS